MSTWTDTATLWADHGADWTGGVAPTPAIPLGALRGTSTSGVVLMSHPFRLDAAGHVATVVQGTPRHAAEAAGHVLSCLPGERPLAPEYGFDEPVGATAVEPDAVAAALVACEPDLQPQSVDVVPAADGRVRIVADVEWAK